MITNLGLAQHQVNFIFEYQDPAGDVLKYNATVNGTPVEDDSAFDGLEIKWIYSQEDGGGNVILKMDLKAKNKFINEDNTKYVFRILTSPENTTGFNITYNNQSTVLSPFSPEGIGTSVDISQFVTFEREKGDEVMLIEVPISSYLDNIFYFSLDAYSMKVTNNATYLDYISEIPGHPEYISSEVEAAEDLENSKEYDENGKENSGDNQDEDGTSFTTKLAIGSIIIIMLIIIALVWLAKKRKQPQFTTKRA